MSSLTIPDAWIVRVAPLGNEGQLSYSAFVAEVALTLAEGLVSKQRIQW